MFICKNVCCQVQTLVFIYQLTINKINQGHKINVEIENSFLKIFCKVKSIRKNELFIKPNAVFNTANLAILKAVLGLLLLFYLQVENFVIVEIVSF